MTDSNVVYVGRLHWVLFLGPIALACFAMMVGIYFYQLKEIALLFVLMAIIWGVMAWVSYQFSSLTIQKKQVILRTGILVRNTVDIPIAKIESIDIRQSLFGSLLGYGMLVITGTGGTRYFVNYLTRPLTCRRYIEQLTYDKDSAL